MSGFLTIFTRSEVSLRECRFTVLQKAIAILWYDYNSTSLFVYDMGPVSSLDPYKHTAKDRYSWSARFNLCDTSICRIEQKLGATEHVIQWALHYRGVKCSRIFGGCQAIEHGCSAFDASFATRTLRLFNAAC